MVYATSRSTAVSSAPAPMLHVGDKDVLSIIGDSKVPAPPRAKPNRGRAGVCRSVDPSPGRVVVFIGSAASSALHPLRLRLRLRLGLRLRLRLGPSVWELLSLLTRCHECVLPAGREPVLS